MDRHAFLLFLRESSLDPFLDPFRERSERLVGGDVRPGCAALETLPLLEMDRAIPDLGGLQRAGNLFFEARMKIRINLPLAGQELIQRVATGPRRPMDAAPQFGDIREVVGPQIVNDSQG